MGRRLAFYLVLFVVTVFVVSLLMTLAETRSDASHRWHTFLPFVSSGRTQIGEPPPCLNVGIEEYCTEPEPGWGQ